LKRKRKQGNSAFVQAPPPTSSTKFQPTAAGLANKARLVATDDKPPPPSRVESPTAPEKVIVDPSKGGAVSPKTSQQSRALEVEPGHWVWDGLVKVLEIDLFSSAWEVRHGAAMALRELLKAQGKYGGTKGFFFFIFFMLHSLILDQSVRLLQKTVIVMNDGATDSQPNFSAFSFSIDLGTSSQTRLLRPSERPFHRLSHLYSCTCRAAQCYTCTQFFYK
jgi:hypothetical protein